MTELASESKIQLSPAPGLERIAAIETHSIHAWPATVVQTTPDGWVLRATPGLPARGRSNHALTPLRPLSRGEIPAALERVAQFAAAHAIDGGIQVSPLELHVPLLDELAARRWNIHQSVLVMTGDTQAIAAGGGQELELTVSDHATPAWLEAWEHCEHRPDVEQHVQTVFTQMAGIARFAHAEKRAVGITVELDGIVGLFCIAVSPDHRRQGLGKRLIRSMLAQHAAPLTYLQVFSENAAGVALYQSLGFREEYRYCHCSLPADDPGRSAASAAAATSGGGC